MSVEKQLSEFHAGRFPRLSQTVVHVSFSNLRSTILWNKITQMLCHFRSFHSYLLCMEFLTLVALSGCVRKDTVTSIKKTCAIGCSRLPEP